MKIGAVFPTTEIGNDPGVIREWAQTAESLGYEHIVTYDHVVGAIHEDRDPPLMGPYTEQDAFHEPMTLYAYLAAVTERIQLVTGILILPQRQTVLVAKQAAEIDLLSSGRFVLGVGTGWNFVEYESLAVPYAGRGRRLDEQVEVLRRLWTHDIVDFEGELHRIDRAGLKPRPESPIPIWFGGFHELAIERAARIGDGFLFGGGPTRMARSLETLDKALAQNGRADAAFAREATIDFAQGPEAWQKELAVWRELGGTHCTLRVMDTAAEFVGSKRMNYQGPGDYIAALERFMKVARDR